MSGRLLVTRQEGVAVLTLSNSGRGNALDEALLDALEQAAAALGDDRALRAAVLTGEGERAFSTGADIAAWGALDPLAFSRQWVARGHRLFERLASLPMPLIGAINGAALGGGLELAALCDVRFAAPHAVFGLPETGLGVTAGWSGLQRLGRLMPQALLREMALTGARLTATRLETAGFINAVSADPFAAALEAARRSAGLSPRATEATRLVLMAAGGEAPAAALDRLAGLTVAATADAACGRDAFLKREIPVFSGA